VVEEFRWPVDVASGMGSFDFVRLAPHCAQDDSVFLPTLFLSDIIF
jgi:hypothetical protein